MSKFNSIRPLHLQVDLPRRCGEFDNDAVPFLLRPEPRNPINMIRNGSRSILDHRFLYETYESGFEEGEGVLDPLEEDLFNHIVWAPRMWRPWEFLFDDCIVRSNEFGLVLKKN